MQIASMHFRERAHEKLADERLQRNLQKIKGKFVNKRRSAITELDDFEGTREAARAIRQRALDDLDVWLELFEENARARGATVLWAQGPDEINRLVLEIAFRHGARKIVKSKSMVSEESALDLAIEGAGLTVVETDLGEYILQINGYEPPSHIVGPALHKSKEEVTELFHRRHGTPRKEGIEELCREARAVLREHYLTADMGISGGNFFVAETGSVVLVTNEGNASLATTLPKVHVAISGIEKIVPTLEDVATLMRLLPRSATGQSISNYVDVLTGARGKDEFHGVDHMYFILVDSGRTGVLASEVRDALRCIRCGACLNTCPVYRRSGGYSYHQTIPGPIGSVLAPLRDARQNYSLPYASSLCGSCSDVCPVKIPLHDLLLKWRGRIAARKFLPWPKRALMKLARVVLGNTWLFTTSGKLARWFVPWMPRWLIYNPLNAWGKHREIPEFPKTSFRELYRKRHG